MNKLNTCCISLLVGAFGTLAMGCLPTGGSDLARYDTANYTPNTDGSGLTGTWVFTLNNEINEAEPRTGEYQRKLVRIAAVDGAANTYEVTSCWGARVARSSAVATGDTVSVLIDGTTYTYSQTTEGRMTAPLYYGDGNVRGTLRAVRLSSDPQFAAGTVGLDFASDNTGTIKRPTVCFDELYYDLPAMDGFNPSDYSLHAVGESAADTHWVEVTDAPIGNVWLNASDDADGYISGAPVTKTNTLRSTVQGIKGTLITEGDYDEGAGSIVLDVKL